MGKMDNFFATQLIELINKNVSKRVQIGRIDLMKNFSFFEVENEQTQTVIESLNNSSVGGRKVSVEVAGEESGSAPRGEGRGEGRKYGAPRRSEGPKPFRASRPKSTTSREERGYETARGPKKKEDWQNLLNGKEPDFSEEGWARRKPKK
jgi:ATP-dependent RNA helicase DeaD